MSAHSDHSQTSHSHSDHAVNTTHIVPVWVYLAVFSALIVGTILTVVVAHLDLGRFNIVAALLIACVKASLVVLFFMHVFYSSTMTKTIVITGFCTLLIMFFFTSVDLISSGWFSGNPWIGVPGR